MSHTSMHHVMEGYVQRGKVPAIVTLICRRGDVQVDAVGEANRATIFRMASMTKPITAAATMILVEEGKLRLEEPVDRLLPELASRRVLKRLDGPLDETVPARRPITVLDLLTFRMGLGLAPWAEDHYPIAQAMISELDIGMASTGAHAPDEWMKRLGALPLMYQPGERWLYHTGSDVLGVLIARASGQPLETFFRERLFEPLGMKDTGFTVPAAKLPRLAAAYTPNRQTGALEVFDSAANSRWATPPVFPSGGSSLVSTVDDYFAFAKMLLNRGRNGSRILSPESVALMTADQLTPEQKAISGFAPGFLENRGWGFGMAVTTRDDATGKSDQYGWYGGFGTSWNSDPNTGLIGILLTQRAWRSPSQPIWQDFWRTAACSSLDN